MVTDEGATGRRRSLRFRRIRVHPMARHKHAHSEGHVAARSVHGAIVVLALLLALQAHPPGPFRSAVLVAGTVLAVLAAEAYAELLGAEIDLGRPPTHEERMAKLRELGVLTASAEGPVVVFVLSGFGLIDEDLAFRLAVWLTLALLFGAGYLARRRAGRSVPASLRSACAAASLGVALALFKHFAHG